MSRATIEQSSLTGIANAIRAKLGVTTTYKPGQMSAAIEAIPGPSTLVSKSITENGTYDPQDDDADGYSGVTVNVPSNITVDALIATENGTYTAQSGHAYSPVTVNVSGGGSVPLLTAVQWDALTTAQKQAYGLVAIQSANTGYARGILVNGADYNPDWDYLPYSDDTKIICAAAPENYSAASTEWGRGTNPVQLSASGSTQNADGSVAIKTKTDGTLAYVDLGAASTPFTAYIVAKLTSAYSNDTRLLCAMRQRSTGQGMLLYGSTNIKVSSWNSDTATGKNPTSYFVGVLQFAGSGSGLGSAISSKNDTVSFITKSPSVAGRYVTIGRTDIGSSTTYLDPSDMDVLFMGVVSEAESQSVISQNMVYLADKFID